MTRIIIGSVAMLRYVPDLGRKPKDFDILSDVDRSKEYHPDDKLRLEQFWHPSMAQIWGPEEDRFATLDELYTLKISHANWELKNGSWNKHMHDAMALKNVGAKLNLDHWKILYKIWEEKHGRKMVSLQQDKEDFFRDAVVRIYDHDSIHESVAYGERPLYEALIREGSTVDMDYSRIWKLDFKTQIKLFKEEVYATALERILIPKNYKPSARGAYHWALRRTMTSLTKGKSARFLAENYDSMFMPDEGWLQRHFDKSDRLVKL